MSSVIPVAADDENILTMATGIISGCIPRALVKGENIEHINARHPELLKIPTATRSPIKVGASPVTILKPSLTPVRNASYTGIFLIMPYKTI